MTPSASRPGGRLPRGRLLLLLIATVLLAMLSSTTPPAAVAQPDPGAADPSATTAGAPAGLPAGGRTYQVTLLTGDVVTLHIAGDGRQAAWLDRPAADGQDPRIVEHGGQVHVIPAEAVPYLESGVLDERLFNVTYLVRLGYHDQARNDLPLMLVAPEGPATRSLPAAPRGTRADRELRSIGAVAVTAGKSGIRKVWESLRGQRAAAPDATGARLAGAGKVWLNGRVQATLDESVPQVGAPAAWRAGYDGSDVKVAVLDTGYDAKHPDLAGKVTTARNFTDDPDPAGATAVDRHGHGTHVAATIAGTGAASDGKRKGVAPGADLVIGKVLDSSGGGYEDDIITGMEWAAQQGARVVSMSLGTPYASDGTDPMSEAVNRLTASSGALFVVAAGNSGPDEQTVGSPGAATQALTVGAVTKTDQPASFSSRGPRVGDGAVKPEIVAPGVDIVAARAAGTSLGNLLDQYYTSLNGTSMATPHVAGAAAILAQRYGGWHADALKARLVSSSKPLDDAPTTFQGGGRVDVAAAAATTVTVDQGVLSFAPLGQNDATATRTLTYHNPTDQPVTLQLSADVTRVGGNAAGQRPLRLSTTVLVIPAGGSASAGVAVSPSGSAGGVYAGQIVARDLKNRATPVHTVTSFSIEQTMRTVTVTAVDRDGKPAGGPVDLWNTQTGEWTRAFAWDGAATAQVPEGVYTVAAVVETAGSGFRPSSSTVAAEPDVTVRGDVTLHFDARRAEPVRVVTPRETHVNQYNVIWNRKVGGKSFSMILAQGRFGEDLYFLPGPKARSGTFELSTTWQLVQPLLNATVAGPGGFPVQPSPMLASERNLYVGEASLSVVDVGTGTAEEFAKVDVHGKVALTTRRGDEDLQQQTESAQAAGATLLLVSNDRPGSWIDYVGNAPLPTYTIDQASGDRLRKALTANPGLTLDVAGRRDSGYSYELAFAEPGRVPGGRTYDVGTQPLATVESSYHQNSDRMGRREMWIPYVGSSGFGTGMGLSRNGPVQRTEYVSTASVQWQRFGQPHSEFANMYWTWSDLEQYQPGRTYRQTWWGPLVGPGVPPLTGSEEAGLPAARFRDAIRIAMPQYRYDNGGRYGFIQQQLGDTCTLTLRRDGQVVGTASWSEAQFTVPQEEAAYELSLTVTNGPGNFADTSVRSETTWRFRSARSEAERTVLPLVQMDYALATGLYNDMPAGTAYPLVVTPGYQPGATGPGGFTVAVEVSLDDGATWTTAPVTSTDGKATATVPASAPGFATVRVVATDADGNSLTQRIDRAWRIAAND